MTDSPQTRAIWVEKAFCGSNVIAIRILLSSATVNSQRVGSQCHNIASEMRSPGELVRYSIRNDVTKSKVEH